MIFKQVADNIAILENAEEGYLITDVQSVMDIIAESWNGGDYKKLIFLKEDIEDSFFDLSTGIAGESLQKLVNYGFRIAVVGDFSEYKSSSLKDFIFESNKGKVIYFAKSVESAVEALLR